MEQFSLPGAGAIIERVIDGQLHILLQQRVKPHAPTEDGLLEIPAGKIRAFESIYDCLRREVAEENGLEVVHIEGEEQAELVESHGYQVLNYQPFSCSQNLRGSYPIMVFVFICRVDNGVCQESDEAKNIRWISLPELQEMLCSHETGLYPMHVSTLRKYLRYRGL